MTSHAERILSWEACANVRDLGGFETEDGGRTRHGAIVRADTTARLSGAGWAALVEHGIRRIVDLQFVDERGADPPSELDLDVVHVSLLGERDSEYWERVQEQLAALPPVEYLAWSYVDFLEHFRDNFTAALRAVADAPEGGVVVHCLGGKDRTGLVCALLLRNAGVSEEDVVADYVLSEENLAEAHGEWVARAPTEEERSRRVKLGYAPATVMRDVLEELDRRYGGVRGYLEAAGLDADEIARLRGRLQEDGGVPGGAEGDPVFRPGVGGFAADASSPGARIRASVPRS
jgi:protein-tyrosine phosphatase